MSDDSHGSEQAGGVGSPHSLTMEEVGVGLRGLTQAVHALTAAQEQGFSQLRQSNLDLLRAVEGTNRGLLALQAPAILQLQAAQATNRGMQDLLHSVQVTNEGIQDLTRLVSMQNGVAAMGLRQAGANVPPGAPPPHDGDEQ